MGSQLRSIRDNGSLRLTLNWPLAYRPLNLSAFNKYIYIYYIHQFCLLLCHQESHLTLFYLSSTSPTEQNEKDNWALFWGVRLARNVIKEECRDTGKRLCLLLEHDKSHSSESVCLDSCHVALSFYLGEKKVKAKQTQWLPSAVPGRTGGGNGGSNSSNLSHPSCHCCDLKTHLHLLLSSYSSSCPQSAMSELTGWHFPHLSASASSVETLLCVKRYQSSVIVFQD